MKKFKMIMASYGVIDTVGENSVIARIYDLKDHELTHTMEINHELFPGYQRKHLIENVIFMINFYEINNRHKLRVHIKYRINLIPISKERKAQVAKEKQERDDIIEYITKIGKNRQDDE